MPQRVAVKVQGDHLERLSKVRSPIHALGELLWNALDADADQVEVRIKENALGAIQQISITDNGHGIDYDEAGDAFGNLGGSWKQIAQRSREQSRLLHGKEGQGRFRAFALGRSIRWDTVSYRSGELKTFSVSAERRAMAESVISDLQEAGGAF